MEGISDLLVFVVFQINKICSKQNGWIYFDLNIILHMNKIWISWNSTAMQIDILWNIHRFKKAEPDSKWCDNFSFYFLTFLNVFLILKSTTFAYIFNWKVCCWRILNSVNKHSKTLWYQSNLFNICTFWMFEKIQLYTLNTNFKQITIPPTRKKQRVKPSGLKKWCKQDKFHK